MAQPAIVEIPLPLAPPARPTFGITRVSKRRWLLAAGLCALIVGVGPFVIGGGTGEHRTTMFDSMGWFGVITVWLFMGGALGLTYREQLRKEHIAQELGLLVDDKAHFLDH